MSHTLPKPLITYNSLHIYDKSKSDEIVGLLKKYGFKKVDKSPEELLPHEYCIHIVKSINQIIKNVYNINWKM